MFDFDYTLMPDSISQFLDSRGVSASDFWMQDVRRLEEAGYDFTLAYLNALLSLIGPNRPLGELTNQQLADFGAVLDDKYYPGIPEVFSDLKTIVRRFKRIDIDFYIISGGLEAMIGGSRIVRDHFRAYYGCLVDSEGTANYLNKILRTISFTEKTRYLYEISKGVSKQQSQARPYLVNEPVAHNQLRIPFQNMIYVGDGESDIPCFAIVKHGGGLPFGVQDPKRARSRQIGRRRVVSRHPPNYGPRRRLGKVLRLAVEMMCWRITIERGFSPPRS